MRRLREAATPAQLDLFTEYLANQSKLDSLLNLFTLQARNTRYLITRVGACGDISKKKRSELQGRLEVCLNDYKTICDYLKKDSLTNYRKDYGKLWAYNENVILAETTSLDDIMSHTENCHSRLKSAILSNISQVEKSGLNFDRMLSYYIFY